MASTTRSNATKESQRGRRREQPSLVLASRLDAELHMILIEELPRSATTITEVAGERQAADKRCADIITVAQQRAKEAELNFRSHIVLGRFVDRVIEFVKENQIDLLVLSLKGFPEGHPLSFGNAAERLIRSAPCAVHVVK